MAEMKPRERILTALRRGTPDRVPWVENDIEEQLQERIMGTTEFTPGELCAKLGMDGFGYHFPMGEKAKAGQAMQGAVGFKQSYYFPQRVTFDFVPPWIAEMGVIPETGRTFIKRGLLDKEDSLKLFDEYLPDPDHPARYERVSEWIARFKGEYAVFARIRMGSASLLESMGIEQFAYNVFDRPDFVKEVHRRFSEWSVRVLEHLNRMAFDFYWVNDDLANRIRIEDALPEVYLRPQAGGSGKQRLFALRQRGGRRHCRVATPRADHPQQHRSGYSSHRPSSTQ